MIRQTKGLYINDIEGKGRGVFCLFPITKGATIEVAPVLVMRAEDRIHLDQTPLHDYIFEWGDENDLCCTAWGYASMYNHEYFSKAEYYMDFEAQTISIIAVQDIPANTEITINYNGDWNDEKKLWFDTI